MTPPVKDLTAEQERGVRNLLSKELSPLLRIQTLELEKSFKKEIEKQIKEEKDYIHPKLRIHQTFIDRQKGRMAAYTGIVLFIAALGGYFGALWGRG